MDAPSNSTDDSLIDRLCRRDERRRLGLVDRDSAIGPEDDHAIQALDALDAALDVATAAPPGPTVGVPDARVPAAPEATADGGPSAGGPRYRVVRFLKRGGLGRVQVAHDEELGRAVALKELANPHAGDPASRLQFLVEAKVTAALEHPGIVPVHGLSVDPAGQPSYAMRLIGGETLRDALGRPPGEGRPGLRSLLRRFLVVCEAIAYAHARGVVHRDLKPENIMLGEHGETLVVDWGAARAIHPTEPDEPRPGWITFPPEAAMLAAMGRDSWQATPAYMSPEQGRGAIESLRPASDIYSLGATLYHLLAGQAPFAGPRNTVVRQVLAGALVPPRQRDATVPADLDAICQRAMAPDPARRYPTVRALAADIEHWMDDQPVEARREPRLDHARRWLRRHRVAAGSIAVGGSMLILGLLGVMIVQAQANRDLAAANGRERARFDLALHAIGSFHEGVSTDLLLRQKGFAPLRSAMLGRARDFYARLEAVITDDRAGRDAPRSRRELGRALHELGRLTSAIGSKDEALGTLRRSLDLRESLGEGDEARGEVAASLLALGQLQGEMGDTNEALRHLDRARLILDARARSRPGDDPEPVAADHRVALARTLLAIGRQLGQAGREAEAIAALERTRALTRELAEVQPNTERRGDQADALVDLANLRGRLNQPRVALGLLREAEAIRRRLAADNPGVAELRFELANTQVDLASQLADLGPADEALVILEQALTSFGQLVESGPAVIEFQVSRASCLNNMALLLNRLNRPAEALDRLEQARVVRAGLVRENPSTARLREQLASTDHNLGTGRAVRDPARALIDFGRARDQFDYLVAAHPEVVEFRAGRAGADDALGSVLGALDRPDEALDALDRALGDRRRLAVEHPAVDEHRANLAMTATNRAILADRLGQADEAIAGHDEARRLRQALVDAHPESVVLRGALVDSLHNLGLELRKAGRLADSLTLLDEARRLAQALADADPADAPLRARSARVHVGLGSTLLAQKRVREALDAYLVAQRIWVDLIGPLGAASPYVGDLATTHRAIGQLLQLAGRFEAAADTFQRECNLLDALARLHPHDLARQRALANGWRRVGMMRHRAGQPAAAIAADHRSLMILEAIPTSSRTGADCVEMAACRARLAAIEADPAARRQLTERAIQLAGEGIDRGYRDRTYLGGDDDLATLKDRPEYRVLLMDLAMPADPFAR